MKKIYIALAVLATASSVSCVRESYNGYVPEKNDVAFYMQPTATKAAEGLSSASMNIALEDGLFLEETVTNLDAYYPETKGTPAYTENVAKLYGSFNAIAYENGTKNIIAADAEFAPEGSVWRHLYDVQPLDQGKTVRYFLRMPADFIDGLNANVTYNTDGSIEFDYNSPLTALGQKDILFTSRTLTKQDYNPKTGAPVLFHHALTGVKFQLSNDDSEISDKGISIDKITFTGLQTSGHCKVSPRTETNGYVDDRTGDYSSGDIVVWGNTELAGKSSNDIYQDFSDLEGLTDFTGSQYDFPGTFKTAKDQNINDKDATYTFWLVPQAMKNTVKLVIDYTINGEEKNTEIDLGKKILAKNANTFWKAGELRTYTLKVNDVGVEITDDIKDGTKSNVTITNTGNCAEFIRVKIMANWVDAAGNPFVGYVNNATKNTETGLYEGPTPDPFVNPWTLVLKSDKTYEVSGGTISTGENQETMNSYGTFTDFPGTDWDWWTKNDGYIYYTEPIGQGASGTTGTNPATTKLFNTFYISPHYRQAFTVKDPMTGERESVEIHLEMDIIIQAIEAKAGLDWEAAWDETE